MVPCSLQEACLAALQAAMELGISRVALETDSINLVKTLSSNTFDQAPGGVIFRDLRVLLSLHFAYVDLAHVSRSCNKCAHELDQSGLQRDPDGWISLSFGLIPFQAS